MSCPFFCYLMARRLNLLMSVMACISFTQRSRLLYGCSKWWINCMAAANGGFIVWLQQMVDYCMAAANGGLIVWLQQMVD